MVKILYFHLNNAPFVSKDIQILKKSFSLHPLLLKYVSSYHDFFSLFKQMVFLVKNLSKNSIYITQFAGYHSLIPTLFGRIFGIKHFIILGGSDCNWLPSINYGNYQKPLLKWATKYSLKYAYHLIPVNRELVECDYNYTDTDFPKQGYKYFAPEITTPYTIIPNGIDLSFYTLKNKIRKPKSFITTCSVLNDSKRRLVKGIDLVIELAKLRTDINITIVGGIFPIEFDLPPNINTIPFIDNDRFPNLYNQYQYYLQLSMTEGFPNALIEAMACGCIPIVSSVGAMPDIVGKVGYLLDKKCIDTLNKIVTLSIAEYSDDKVTDSRKQAEKYDIKIREKLLFDLINQIT